MRCVIAGAGISGLALAWELQRRGIEPIVLESEARAGGKIRSERDQGFLCEWGPASFSDRSPSAKALVEELGLGPRTLHAGPAARRREAVADGRVAAIPSTAGEFLSSPLLSGTAKLRALEDLALPIGPAGRGEEESVAAFARRRLGAVAGARLLYPVASGIYAGDPERISLPSAFPWLAALEASDRSLLRGMERLRREGREPGSSLVTFVDGLSELTFALAARLGARLRRSAKLTAVARRGHGFLLHVDEGGRAVEIEADRVVLAIPAHAAAPLLAPIDAGAADAAAAIEYLPVTLVHAGYPARALARPLEGYGFLVLPGEPSELLGAFYTSTLFPGRAPEGELLLSARLGGARRPTINALDDERITRVAVEGLAKLLPLEVPPRWVRIIRHHRALPHYTLGHRERVAEADAAETRLPGLYLTGNAWRGLGVAECIANAAPLAERIAGPLASR